MLVAGQFRKFDQVSSGMLDYDEYFFTLNVDRSSRDTPRRCRTFTQGILVHDWSITISISAAWNLMKT